MRVAIDALEPEWLDGDEDWGMGLRCLCPVHDGDEAHRIELWFETSCGGYEVQAPDATRYRREGSSFITLTLEPIVDVPGCFRGWLIDGLFFVLDN